MEVFLKVSIYVCLFTVSFGFHLAPPFHIKTPLDFEIGVNPLQILHNNYPFTNTPKDTSFSATNRCFCLPNNTNSQLVTEHLSPHESVERLVVYLYSVGGVLKVFIPNYQKQAIIPDLNFDISQGDILKPAFSSTVFQIFKDGPVTVQGHPSVASDEDKNKDNIVVPVDQNPNTDITSPPENTSETPIIEDNDNENIPDSSEISHGSDEDINSTDTPSNIDSEHYPGKDIDFDITIPVHDSYDIHTESTPSDETSNDSNDEIHSLDETTNTPEVDESTGGEDSFEVSTVEPSSLLEGIQTLIPEEHKSIFNLLIPLILKNHSGIITGVDVGNNFGSDRLQQILSMLPQKVRVHVEILLAKLKNRLSQIVTGNDHTTFDDWFKSQLARVVIQKLDASMNIDTLRQRIIQILENNGLYLTKNGVLIDVSGNVHEMANIKLRPILIGDPVEYQNMLNYQSNEAKPNEISYFQVILITKVNPPSILGIIPLGKVFLPRELKRDQNIYFLNHSEFFQPSSIHTSGILGCKFCKGQSLLKNFIAKIKPYFQQLKLFPSSRTGEPIAMRRYLRKPANQIGDANLNTFLPRLPYVFEAPRMFGNQMTNRFLASSNARIPFFKPRVPYDDLPGIRIIGGHPATSSGTPLVSKGRSAFPII